MTTRSEIFRPELGYEDLRTALFEERRFRLFVGAALLLTLQFQTLPLMIKIQTLPVTTVLAVLFFPLVIRDIPRSPLLVSVAAFFAFAVAHSAIALCFEFDSPLFDVRFYAWLRQLFALGSGVATYLVLRTVLLDISDDRVAKYIAIGAIPSFALALLNIAWGAFGQLWAGNIVFVVRQLFSPEGYIDPFRAAGLATEPASLASSIVIIVVPMLFYLFGARRRGVSFYALLAVSLFVFAWTFSTTGILLLFAVLGFGLLLGPHRNFVTWTVLLFLLTTVIGMVFFPNNQILRLVGVLMTGQSSSSFSDRFYSAFGPFIKLLESYSFYGYGLGGMVTHFREVIPVAVQAEILSQKIHGLPSLTIIFGRVFAESGVVGLILFLSIFPAAFVQLQRSLRRAADARRTMFLRSVRLGLIAVVSSIFFSIGPYHIPTLWIWLAVIDARYVSAGRTAPGGVGPVRRAEESGSA